MSVGSVVGVVGRLGSKAVDDGFGIQGKSMGGSDAHIYASLISHAPAKEEGRSSHNVLLLRAQRTMGAYQISSSLPDHRVS